MAESLRAPRGDSALAPEAFPDPEKRLSQSANALRSSEILRISGEIRALTQAGHVLCDLTVGDFSPRHFPIPAPLEAAIHAALERGETNYPPAAGLPALREAVLDFYDRELGLTYPLESVLILSGSRPAIYGVYRTLCDPGDRVVYSVPSWNNNYYTQLVGSVPVPLPCGPAERFLPSRESVRQALPGARLLALCSPLNPAGTVFERDTLFGICEDVLRENRARERRGERPLFVLYDQVYWALTFGTLRHYTPPGLLPEIAPYTLLVDGISKAFAATGLRVGWAVGPADVIAKLTSLAGHLGSWAPRPEQAATAALLRDGNAVREFREAFKLKLRARLERLHRGFQTLKAEGLPVDSLEPAGAMYLSARLAPFGKRTREGATLDTNDAVRRHLLRAAGVAVIPFQAFGSQDEDGWFRLSAGTVSEQEIDEALARIAAALRALR